MWQRLRGGGNDNNKKDDDRRDGGGDDDEDDDEQKVILPKSDGGDSNDEAVLANKVARVQFFSVADVYTSLAVSPVDGLSGDEASRRFAIYGPNMIMERPKPHILWRMLSHFTHLMAMLLWVAGVLAWVGDSMVMGIAIWMVNVLNGTFSFYQEFQADQAAQALRKLLPVEARVIRDGEQRVMPATQLVPGDVILVEEGVRLSADCRVTEGSDLMVDQSTFTGESVTRAKTSDPVPETPEEQAKARTMFRNLVFCGTSVVGGSAKAVVLATGMRTEFGQIAQKTLDVVDTESPLQKEMRDATKTISIIAMTIGCLIFVATHTLVKVSLHHSAIFAIGMAVAFIPEGLLPLVTLSLARASLRMASRGAIVKKLSAVETLGCTSAICTDKTGTLTLNEMSVGNVWLAATNSMLTVEGDGYEPRGQIVDDRTHPQDASQLRKLTLACNLCNNAALRAPGTDGNATDMWTIVGDPTEAALLCLATKAARVKAEDEQAYVRVGQISFSSERKRMSTVHRHTAGGGATTTLFTKGAPSAVVALATSINVNGTRVPITDEHVAQIREAEMFMARKGQRVLGVAKRDVTGMEVAKKADADILERELVFIGLVGMFDPPRENVREAVADCHIAGIRVVMITGDNAVTASSIAEQIGLRKFAQTGKIKAVEGGALCKMSDDELKLLLIETVDMVFARTLPTDKMRVVAMLQELGHVVAVTGDGVNDAPALKKSDIGVAMGIGGTDVAKSASEIILTDNNFASIVHAVKEGRTVYENIKKFLVYILASNTAEAVPFIFFIASGGRIPLAIPVLLVLAIDLGTDMVPALALGADPPNEACMTIPPRDRTEPFFNGYLLFRGLLWLGVMEGAIAMGAFFFYMRTHGHTDLLALPSSGPIYAGAISMTFAAVVFAQVGCVFACRSNTHSFTATNVFNNRLIWVGVIFELIFTLFTVFVPGFHAVFGTGVIPWVPHIIMLLVCVPLMLLWSDIGIVVTRVVCPGFMGLLDKTRIIKPV